jgi:chemotaxis protein CheD
MAQTIEVADLKVSACKDDILITYALGSCIGLCIFDPESHIGGLLHYMLPMSKRGSMKNPFAYADTGILMLLQRYQELGGSLSRAVLKAAGGATLNRDEFLFRIGEQNIEALHRELNRFQLRLAGMDLGGTCSRTLRFDLHRGLVLLKKHTQDERPL